MLSDRPVFIKYKMRIIFVKIKHISSLVKKDKAHELSHNSWSAYPNTDTNKLPFYDITPDERFLSGRSSRPISAVSSYCICPSDCLWSLWIHRSPLNLKSTPCWEYNQCYISLLLTPTFYPALYFSSPDSTTSLLS